MRNNINIEKRNKKWNKKGFENWEDVGMFFLVSAIVGGGIFIGLWIMYSVSGDVRLEEAKIISLKLENEILDNGYLSDEILSEDYSVRNLMIDSKIDEGVLNSGGYFYFKVEVRKGDELIKNFEVGKGSFEVECFLKGDSLPVCFDREIKISSIDGENYIIYILTGSNQLGERL